MLVQEGCLKRYTFGVNTLSHHLVQQFSIRPEEPTRYEISADASHFEEQCTQIYSLFSSNLLPLSPFLPLPLRFTPPPFRSLLHISPLSLRFHVLPLSIFCHLFFFSFSFSSRFHPCFLYLLILVLLFLFLCFSPLLSFFSNFTLSREFIIL